MLIGAQEPTVGGLHRAFPRAVADGCEALQVFTAFPTRWAPRRQDDEDVRLFREARATFAGPVLSHGIYLINLASPDRELRRRSLAALLVDLLRCEELGVEYLVLHPGSHGGAGVDAGLRRISRSLGELHRRAPGLRARILLENTAGQGDCLGARFEELARILEETPGGERLGICLDTCHAWAAGHDLASAGGYAEVVGSLERLLGQGRVLAFHLNDSLRPRGSRVDRHTHIGEGTLGRAAFRRLVNDPRFATVPAVVETPAEPDGSLSFGRNVRTLKAMRRRRAPARRVGE